MEGMNMADMFGRVMEMQQKMSEAQQVLETKSVTAEAGGGMVKVTANGAQRITPLAVEARAITVGAPDAFHQRLLGNQHDFLVKHLQAFDLEEISRLTFTVRQDLETSTPQQTASDVDPQEYMQRKRQENPVIQAIFEQFGGELVW